MTNRKKEWQRLTRLLTEASTTHRRKNLVQAALEYGVAAHAGERFKHIPGVYFDHVKAVSDRQTAPEAKVVAILHDVVENRVRAKLGKNPDREKEKALIKATLDEIEIYFKNCGHDARPLIPHIDALTKRLWQSYKEYIVGLADRAEKEKLYYAIAAKKSDLDHNSREDRNLRPRNQSDGDRQRLGTRYPWAREFLTGRFPPDRYPMAEPRPLNETDHRRRPGRPPADPRRSKGDRLRWAETGGPLHMR